MSRARFARHASHRRRGGSWRAPALIAAVAALVHCGDDVTVIAAIHIGTNALPSGQVGIAYAAALSASGGTAPYRWSMTSGTMPAGLSLAPSGTISGSPSAPGTKSVTFMVTDSEMPPQAQSATLGIAIAGAPLSVTSTALADGQVGRAYSLTLTASGGTPPYGWSILSGALPQGLSLNAQSGTITGTPTVATANQQPISVQVRDSGTPPMTASTSLTLNVSPAALSVSVSPQRAAVTITQSISLVATTNDYAGVNWSITPSGATLDRNTSLSETPVSFMAPASAGVYTVTATSVTDGTTSSSVAIAVTDLAGVFTYHNDLARDGVNAQEYALTRSSVSSATFGKLFSCSVDGAVYAQPLWVANLTIGDKVRNVVFVATEHDGLFAFDADASPCVQLWSVNLIDAAHGGGSQETPVPFGAVGKGRGDIAPEIGVTGTPVIDPAAGTLYIVSKSTDSSSFFLRLHAIDLKSGNEKAGAPVTITATYPGAGDGGTIVTLDPRQELQRAGLALVNGIVYVAFASHEDAPPFYGWLIGYRFDGSTFTQAHVFNVAPNTGLGGIWMSGGAPAADSGNNLYVLTGNAILDANRPGPMPNNDYGDSLLQLSPSLTVSQYFAPTNQDERFTLDHDFGAGGAAVLVDLPAGGPVAHLVVGGGKDDDLYLINRDALGGLGDANAWQVLGIGGRIFSTPAVWNYRMYIAGGGGSLREYQLDPTTDKFALATSSQTPSGGFSFPGSTPAVSASQNTNGIVWAIDAGQYCTSQSRGCGPAVLHAYDATNVAEELWNSSMVRTDAAGYAVKFAVPTVANGKVYVGTRGNDSGGADTSMTVPGELDVYGLK